MFLVFINVQKLNFLMQNLSGSAFLKYFSGFPTLATTPQQNVHHRIHYLLILDRQLFQALDCLLFPQTKLGGTGLDSRPCILHLVGLAINLVRAFLGHDVPEQFHRRPSRLVGVIGVQQMIDGAGCLA